MYISFILPHMEYGYVVSDCANQSLLSKLDQIHYRAGLIVSGCPQGTSHIKLLECLGWVSLQKRRTEKKYALVYDFEHNSVPTYFFRFINPVQDRRQSPNERLSFICSVLFDSCHPITL
jgi:hypothetical protein